MGVFKRAEEMWRRRDPKPVGEILPALLEKLGVDADFAGGDVFSKWQKIVGQQIAANCRPRRIKNGVLIAAVSSSAWLMELTTFHKAAILAKIQKATNNMTINDIHFTLGAEEL